MSRVTIYHNVTSTRHGSTLAPAIFARTPSGYQPGDRVATAFSYVDERPATSILTVCERAFELGNIDEEMTRDSGLRDLVKSYRAEKVRSVSVGDVVSIDGRAYAVAPYGFTDLGPAAGLEFAGGRTAREVRDLVDTYESDPNRLTAADLAFVTSTIV